ncbi:hypothetical protein [Pseudodesulfovibrio sediminis]|uniref:Uncharacterized protein n=1 Tax=Pseudodesulfovibrio sediminis TaxID=2810563 RepID=A0ABN6EPI6_9BACT|nr:hypothetical protein [Pseudodesulfovibrio sediminis]BCS87111.1 hypothetical protein PSDVSF_03530 [Pseudodesulfovibrio sediminis]
MSDISISTNTIQSMAMENQISGPEFIPDQTSEISSGMNSKGLDSMEQAVTGAEVASKTEDFIGAGTDFGSTGTDIDIQQAVNSTLSTGIGSIADTIA